MSLVVRSALQQDYEDLYTLFAEGDRVHYEALPQVFQPRTGPVRTPEFLAEILSNADAALFVAEDHGRLIGFIRSSLRTVPLQPGIVSRRFLFWEFNTEARALYEKLGYVTRRRTMGKQLP